MGDRQSMGDWPLLVAAGVILGATMAVFEDAVSQQVVGFGLFVIAAVLVGAGIRRGPEDDNDD